MWYNVAHSYVMLCYKFILQSNYKTFDWFLLIDLSEQNALLVLINDMSFGWIIKFSFINQIEKGKPKIIDEN